MFNQLGSVFLFFKRISTIKVLAAPKNNVITSNPDLKQQIRNKSYNQPFKFETRKNRNGGPDPDSCLRFKI